MAHRHVAMVAVALMITLAGCSYDTTVGIRPEVRDGTFHENGTYSMTLTAHSDGGDIVEFTDVRIYGYSLTGELVCTADFDGISGKMETQRVLCTGFPSILVPATEKNGTREHEGYVYEITHVVTLYRGTQNGTPAFDTLTTVPNDRSFSEIGDRPIPDDSLLQTANCLQWRDGGNYSAVESAPWTEWEQIPPNTSRRYTLGVINYSLLSTSDGTTASETDGLPVYTVDALSPAARRLVTEGHPIGTSQQRTVDAATFFRAVSALVGEQVNDFNDLTLAFREIDGETGHWNNSGIDCRANPPHYYGTSGYYVHVLVEYEETVYQIRIRTRQSWSGPATTLKSNESARVAGFSYY